MDFSMVRANFMTLDALADAMNLTGAAREKRRPLRTELIKRVRQARSGENLDSQCLSGRELTLHSQTQSRYRPSLNFRLP